MPLESGLETPVGALRVTRGVLVVVVQPALTNRDDHAVTCDGLST